MATDREALLLQMAMDLRTIQKSVDRANGITDGGFNRMEKRADAAARAVEKSLGGIRLPNGLRREINDLGTDIGTGLRRASDIARIALAGVSAYAIKLAMDAGEIESAFDVAFKGSAKSAREFADVLAGRVGRDAVETRQAMTRLQLVLTGTGIAAQQAAEMTKRLAEVGIDAGSLFNTSDAEAFQKIISGLTGEAEPLKAFGVVINEAAVKTELLRLGFKGTAAEASESAKSVARANLIIKGLAVAQGDATRTAGSAANQTRAMRAEFNAAARDLGNQLLPTFVKLTRGATDTLKAFNDLPGGVQIAGLAFLALIAAGGPIAGLLANFARVIKLAKDARIAIAGVVAANTAAGASTAAPVAGAAVAGAGLAGASAVTGVGLIGVVAGREIMDAPAAARRRAAVSNPGAANTDDLKALQSSLTARLAENARNPNAPLGGYGDRNQTAAILAKISDELLKRAGTAAVAAAAAGKPSATPDATVQGGFSLTPAEQLGTGGGKKKKAKKGPAAPRDLSDEQSAQIAAQIAAADRDVLRARLDLATGAEARAELEKQIVAKGAEQEDARLAGQIAALKDNKGISDAKRAELIAALESLRLKNAEVVDLQAQAIDREKAFALEDAQIAIYAAITEAQIAQLEAEASIATTAAQRNAIEKRILELRQQLEQDLRGTQIDRDFNNHSITTKQAAEQRAALGATQAADQTRLGGELAGPVQRYLDSLKDVDTEMQNLGVSAAQDLATGLADAIVNAKSLGDVARNVFQRMIADLLASAIQRDITGPILGSLFGVPSFAVGTNFAPGGLAKVHKDELINLPRGSQVIPASQSLAALQNLQMPTRTHAVTVVQPFHFHAEGAVVTSELLAQANAQARAFANSAAAGALKQANRSLPQRQRSMQLLGR